MCHTHTYTQTHNAPWGHWCQSTSHNLRLRGSNYLTDKKKVAAEQAAYRLVHVDFFTSTGARVDNVGAHPEGFVTQRRAEQNQTGQEASELLFVVNLQVPGTPRYNLVLYFEPFAGRSSAEDRSKADLAADVCMQKFVAGDDAYRTRVFKFIPHVIEGGVVVSKTVGNIPVSTCMAFSFSFYLSHSAPSVVVLLTSSPSSNAQRIHPGDHGQ
jgi:hypothetical protein